MKFDFTLPPRWIRKRNPAVAAVLTLTFENGDGPLAGFILSGISILTQGGEPAVFFPCAHLNGHAHPLSRHYHLRAEGSEEDSKRAFQNLGDRILAVYAAKGSPGLKRCIAQLRTRFFARLRNSSVVGIAVIE